jgi:hypothetical protein
MIGSAVMFHFDCYFEAVVRPISTYFNASLRWPIMATSSLQVAAGDVCFCFHSHARMRKYQCSHI